MRVALGLLVALLAAAGCGGGDVTEDELRSVVLQKRDLPPLFVRFDYGPIRAIELTGMRADPERFGRIGGWKARYRRRGTLTTEGPLVVESTADAFESVEGAQRDLRALDRELRGRRRIPVELGDESFAAMSRQVSGISRVRFYTIVWREGNASASLTVNGFDGRLRLEHALVLARKQDERLSEAARD